MMVNTAIYIPSSSVMNKTGSDIILIPIAFLAATVTSQSTNGVRKFKTAVVAIVLMIIEPFKQTSKAKIAGFTGLGGIPSCHNTFAVLDPVAKAVILTGVFGATKYINIT